MRELDKSKMYNLSELNSRELKEIWILLKTTDVDWSDCEFGEVINESDKSVLYFNSYNWEWDNTIKLEEATNAKELFYTLENIQVDCRDLSEEQIKEMCEVFIKNGYDYYNTKSYALKIDYKCAFMQCYEDGFLIDSEEEDKTTITYEKFMELFSNKEENFKKLVEVLNEELTEKAYEVSYIAEKPKQYQIGIDTFERCEANMTKEENKADRYNNGKLKWSLVDFDALEDMVKVLEFGAKKYSADNWKKGLYTKEIAESLIRHLQKYLKGEDLDLESNLPHTGHILCNAMFLSYMMNFNKKFDNRIKDTNKFCCGNWDEKGECKCK